MVPKLLELLVLHMVTTFVRHAPMDILRMVIRAMNVVQRVDLDSEKQLNVLHRLIVFVLKTFVLVPSKFQKVEEDQEAIVVIDLLEVQHPAVPEVPTALEFNLHF